MPSSLIKSVPIFFSCISLFLLPKPIVSDHTGTIYPCKDNLDYMSGFCQFVTSDEQRRLELCTLEETRVNCPIACGLCCANEATFTFTSDSGFERKCWWIEQMDFRKTRYCDRLSGYGIDSKICNHCPRACGICQPYVSVHPSSSPSDSPSFAPTKSPTVSPTATPTIAPSVSPTTCENTLEFDFTGSVSTCDWVGRNESRRAHLCSQPFYRKKCPITCGLCCKDDPTFQFSVKSSGETIVADCAWVSKFPYRKEKCCNENPDGMDRYVKEACPLACDACFESVE